MEIALIIALVLQPIIYIIFLLFGYKMGKKEDIKIPTPTTVIKTIEERKTKKEYQEQQEELNKMLENIDIYDGTSLGQKELK